MTGRLIGSPQRLARRRGMMQVVRKARPRFGSRYEALAWYRCEPLPGFSGKTAMQLVRKGRTEEVLEFIDAVDAGLHT